MEWTIQFDKSSEFCHFKLAVQAALGSVDVTDIDVSHSVCLGSEAIEVIAFHEGLQNGEDDTEDCEDGFIVV